MKKTYQPINETIYSWTLKNGLKVLLIPNDQYVSTNAGIAFEIGANDSAHQIKINGKAFSLPLGVAHFLEHRMFDYKEGPIFDLYSAMGANANAYTSYNRTVYYFTGATDPLKAVELLLKYTNDFSVTKESVENEKGIIIEELKMYLDTPSDVVMQGVLKNLYYYHMLKEDIGGTIETVSATTVEDLIRAHRHFYHPSNGILVVTGKFELDSMLKMIKKFHFKDIDKGELIKKTFEEPTGIVQKYQEKVMDVAVSCIGLGIKLPAFNHATFALENFSLELLLAMMFSETTKFYNQLLQEGLLSNAFIYSLECLNDCAFIYLYNEIADIKLFQEKIVAAFQNIDQFILEKEFKKVKNGLIGSKIREFNSASTILSNLLGESFMPTNTFEAIKTIAKIKLSDIKKAAASIDINNLTTFVVKGKK